MNKDLSSYILTRKEFQIMKVVWELGSATVRDICSAQPFNNSTAYSTVLTFMRILEKKGVLVHTESGRTFVYEPLLTREQAIRNQINDLTNRFFDGDFESLIEAILADKIKPDKQCSVMSAILDSYTEKKIA